MRCRSASASSRFHRRWGSLPVDLLNGEHVPRRRDPLEIVCSAVADRDPFPGDQVSHGPRDQDLPGARQRHDARRRVDGDPAHLAFGRLGFAEVEPRPDVHTDRSERLDRVEGTLNPGRRSIEDCEDAVTRRIDDASAAFFDEMTHDFVMLAKEAFPRLVAHVRRELGRAHDVREQDCDEDVLALGWRHEPRLLPGPIRRERGSTPPAIGEWRATFDPVLALGRRPRQLSSWAVRSGLMGKFWGNEKGPEIPAPSIFAGQSVAGAGFEPATSGL